MTRPVTWRYKPANTKADLRPESKNLAMDAFLLSPRLQRPTTAVAQEIALIAKATALVEASDTTAFANAFVAAPGPPMVVGGNPRVSARVSNSDPAAAPNEFGNVRILKSGKAVEFPAKRILGRSGEPFHTPRGIS